MTPERLSPRSEFTPVPSHGSIFVYMIPPQSSCWRESPQRISLRYEISQRYHETNRLQNSFNKFVNRHGFIVDKYGAALREMRLAIQA